MTRDFSIPTKYFENIASVIVRVEMWTIKLPMLQLSSYVRIDILKKISQEFTRGQINLV